MLGENDQTQPNSANQGIHLSCGQFQLKPLNLFSPANRLMRPRATSSQVNVKAEIKRAPGQLKEIKERKTSGPNGSLKETVSLFKEGM